MSPIGSYSMKETSNAVFTLFAGGFLDMVDEGPVLAAAGLVVFCSSAFGATEWDAKALLSGMLSFFASGFLTLGVATLGADILESSVIEVFILMVGVVESANI